MAHAGRPSKNPFQDRDPLNEDVLKQPPPVAEIPGAEVPGADLANPERIGGGDADVRYLASAGIVGVKDQSIRGGLLASVSQDRDNLALLAMIQRQGRVKNAHNAGQLKGGIDSATRTMPEINAQWLPLPDRDISPARSELLQRDRDQERFGRTPQPSRSRDDSRAGSSSDRGRSITKCPQG